jgi:hypothetical protein
MNKKQLSNMYTKRNKVAFVLVLALFLIPAVLSLEFTQTPSINNNERPYLSNQNLICGWTSTGETNFSIDWYRAETSFNFNVVPAYENETTIPSSATSIGNRWYCSVTLYNETNSLSQNSSIAHIAPWLAFANDSLVPYEYNLFEGTEYTFFIKSAVPGQEGVTFSMASQTPAGLCEPINTSSGEIRCTPRHIHVAGTESPAVESITPFSMLLREEIGDSFVASMNFTLIPVNDQAIFVGNYTNQSILANNIWTLDLEGVDEELDHPLIFTLTGTHPSTLVLNQTSNTTATLYFDTITGMPGNFQEGDWTITVNLTDNASFNASRPASILTFGLQINTTNFPPELTTNFSIPPNGTQYEEFTFYINATDPDSDDELNIFILRPLDSDYACPVSVDFPWQNDLVMLDNSSENTTARINTTLNITHVICRYVDIEVHDGEGGIDAIRNVFFNISNVNDPPTLHEIGINGNISNQTATQWSFFEYQLNATDPDSLTYNAHLTANLTYSSNDSRFQVNSTTGLINMTLENPDLVGSWVINYSVTDGEYTDYKLMNLEILPNSPPVLNLSLVNSTYNQNETILVRFQATEFDGENITISINSLTDFNTSMYTVLAENYIDGDGYNQVNYTINLTKTNTFDANAQVGHHRLQVNLQDERGASNESSVGEIEFTILNTNDAPFFITPPDTKAPITVTLGVVVAGVPYNTTIYAQDFDLLLPPEFANESLSYLVSNSTSNIINLQITKLAGSEDRARLTFTPQSIGNASFLLRVTDSQGLFEEQNVSFTILGTTDAPNITHIKPYESSGNVVYSFSSRGTKTQEQINFETLTQTEWDSSCALAQVIQVPPDTPLILDALATFDNITEPDNNITYRWYVEGVSVLNITNATPGVNTEFLFEQNINVSTLLNISLEVVDIRYSTTSFSWLALFQVGNRPPSYCENSLEDLEISGSTIIPDYFSNRLNMQRFYDPDEDLNMNGRRFNGEGEPTSLTYRLLNPSACGLIDFSFFGDQLTLIPRTTGICIVRFTATDPGNLTVISDNVTIVVTDVVQQQTTTTSVSTPTPIPIPFQEEVDVPKPLRILFPGNASLFSNQTITLPVIIENTYSEQVRGISLSAEMPDHPEMTYQFGVRAWTHLDVGQKVETILTITNFRAEEAPYEIRVNVNVTEPRFTDGASVIVGGLEQSGAGDDREVRVTFARDMLSDNPECQELNDYLDMAQQMLASGQVREAGELVNAIINGCNSLIRGEEFRLETPGLVRRFTSFSDEYSSDIILWVGILTTMTIGLYVVLSVKEKLLKIN